MIIFKSPLRQFTFSAGYKSMEMVEKAPTEEIPVEWEFKSILPENEVVDLTQSSILIVDEDGLDVSSSLAGALELINDTKLRTKISTGTNGVDYTGKFKGKTLPNGYKLEGTFLLQVRDKMFSV
jgi:hypothetical protein